MSESRFTLIIPAYNGGEYLKQCINSILEQSRSDWEIAVLDNASQDGTSQWLQTLTDRRIFIYRSEIHLSIEDNWQRALHIPQNQFLTLIGHDDLLDRNYLQVMHDLIEQKPDAGLYQTQFRLIDAQGQVIRAATPQPLQETAAQFLAARLTRQRESFGTGYMMRSHDYLRVGGIPDFKGLIFSDDALWIKLMQSSYKATSDKETFSYRVHSNSSSVLASGEIHLEAIEQYLAFLAHVAAGDNEIQQTLETHSDYFLWHTHYAYLLMLTQSTRQNRRLERSVVNRFNVLLSSLEPSWSLKTNRTKGLRIRENINRFGITRRLYNFYQHEVKKKPNFYQERTK